MFLVLLNFSLIAYSGLVIAEDYHYEGTDDIYDVEEPDVDIKTAKIEECGDNLIFTITVDANITPDDKNTSYSFILKEQVSYDDIRVEFKYTYNPETYYARIYDTNPIIIEEIVYNLQKNDTLTLTANKSWFSNTTLPWNVTVTAKTGDTVDSLLLTDYDVDSNNQDDSKDEVPGFEITVVMITLFIAIIVLKRK